MPHMHCCILACLVFVLFCLADLILPVMHVHFGDEIKLVSEPDWAISAPQPVHTGHLAGF